MPDFTAEQTEAARREPRPGDVWRHNMADHDVTIIKPHYKEIDGRHYMVIRSSRASHPEATPAELIRIWTRNATLVRRGDA